MIIRLWTAPAALGVVVGLVSCGGGGGGTTPVTPTVTLAPAPVRTVVAQGNFTLGAPEADGRTFFRRTRFETTRAGSLEVNVEWTYAANEIWMYLADGDCTSEQFASDECPGAACPCRFVVVSETSAPKPRVLTVSNAAAGARTLIVWNLGPREEACSFQATLTATVAGASSTSHPVQDSVGGRKQLRTHD